MDKNEGFVRKEVDDETPKQPGISPWTDLNQNDQAPARDDQEYPMLTNAIQSKSKLRNAHVPKQSNLSNSTTTTTHGSSPSETVTQAQDLSPAPVDELPHDEITGQDHSALDVPDLSSLSVDVSETVTQEENLSLTSSGLVTKAIAKDWSPTDDEIFCKALRPQAQADFLTSHGPFFSRGGKRMPCFTDDMHKYGKLPQLETVTKLPDLSSSGKGMILPANSPSTKVETTKKQRSPTPPLEESPHGTDLNQNDQLAPARDDTYQQRSPTPPPPLEASPHGTDLNQSDQAPARDDQEYPMLTNAIQSKSKLRNAHVRKQ